MSHRSKVTLAVFALLLGVYALLRLGFLLANLSFFENAGAGDIAMAFVFGLRFDISALIILNLVPLLLYNWPWPRQPRWYLGLIFAVFAVVNLYGVLINLADYRHYPAVQRRLLHEPWQDSSELVGMFPQWYHEHPVLVVGGLAAGALFLILIFLAVRALRRRIPGKDTAPRMILSGVLITGLCVLGIRGGLQEGILRPADAFKHSSHFSVGYLTLNSTYTTLLSLILKPIQVVEKMPEAEARAVVREMIYSPDEEPVDPDYPFMRRKTPAEPMRKLNVVILLMESWTSVHVGPQEGGASRTPAFDALAKDGLRFTSFLSTGHKSNAAVPSILTSVPSLFRQPVIGSREELTRFRGLGSILKEHGYSTSFHYGVDKTIMGFDAYAALAGFDKYFSVEDYPETGDEVHDGRWGIFDELYFLFTVEKLDEMQEPFTSLIFSMSPHDPYILPKNRQEMFAAYEDEGGYEQLLRYSDFALGRFFEEARKRKWFENTIFVITADHTRFSTPNSYYESVHIPLAIYAPGIIEPGVDDTIGSQADVLPTILDLLHVPTVHASMGRSLLDRSDARGPVVYREQGFGIFGNEFALVNDLDEDVGLFRFRDDRYFEQDLGAERPGEADDLRKRLYAYLQIVTNTVRNDRVYREER